MYVSYLEYDFIQGFIYFSQREKISYMVLIDSYECYFTELRYDFFQAGVPLHDRSAVSLTTETSHSHPGIAKIICYSSYYPICYSSYYSITISTTL